MISTTNEKTSDWGRRRSLRRFPENNNTIGSNINSNAIKSEVLQHHNWISRDNEQNDINVSSLLSSKLMNSSNIRTPDPDSSSNNALVKRIHSNSPTSSPGDDGSFNHLINYMSSQTKSISKVSRSSLTIEPESILSVLTDKTPKPESIQNQDSFVKSVLQNGDYLLKYSSWHEFRGAEEVAKCSKKVIERNENIWELVAIEYSHFRLLVNIRDVYYKSYPYLEAGSSQLTSGRRPSTARSDSIDSSRSISFPDTKDRSNNFFESIDTILPGLDQLIACHARICDCLVNKHLIRPDRVITEIGRVLHESIPDDFIPTLAELYGRINYTKQYINQKLSQFKKYPVFLSYIHKCERDPKCDKKTLADILLHISIHWSKKVTTLNSIIVNTINDSHDLNNLMKFKEKVDKIVNEASNVMDKQMNSKLLQNLVENYEITPDMEDSERVFKFMTTENAKLIYNGKVQFELKKSGNGKLFSREVHGVALEKCIFFLQILNEPGKTSPKYQLFKDRDSVFPALLEWGKLYGYFREEDSKNSDTFSFYVIIEKPKPSIKRMFVGTPHDRGYWKKCMMQGFSRWQSESSDIKEADVQLNEEMKKIEKKWTNTQFGIELINHLDCSLRAQLEYRTVGFRCILEEELKRITRGNGVVKRGSTNSMEINRECELGKDESDSSKPAYLETYLPDLTTPEGIHNWLEVFMEWVNRLKFSLCSSGSNITRSASEIEAWKRPSVPTVKKYDTFSSRDSPTFEKRQPDVTFHNPPITKHKKDQRRISVTGFTNLFRKTVKPEEINKENEQISPSDTNTGCELDNMTLSKSKMVSENDCFLAGLSKDTVVAFNEINMAAKNITMELINLRTKNMILEAEVKKLQDENHSFKEFLRKYQRSAGDGQLGIVFGNSCQLKSDTINSSLGMVGLNGTESADLISDGLEILNENSSGYAHINQKIIECRTQTENLRQMYEQFAQDKKKWEKEYEAQRRKIENDKENMFQRHLELQKEKEILTEKENKYKESCLNLQKKMDMYLEYAQLQSRAEDSPIPGARLQKISQMKSHISSHSDETIQKRMFKDSAQSSGPLSPPLASTEATLYNLEHRGRGNLISTHNSNIPDQLRGSLINQERQSLKTNSSDNILQSRGHPSNSSTPIPKMTPSIDRKEIYSSSTMRYSLDDEEDRGISSDLDEVQSPSNRSVKENMSVAQQSRKSITSLISKTISMYDNNKEPTRNPVIGSTTPDLSGSKASSIGIPLALATKSKVKKEKTRKFKLI